MPFITNTLLGWTLTEIEGEILNLTLYSFDQKKGSRKVATSLFLTSHQAQALAQYIYCTTEQLGKR